MVYTRTWVLTMAALVSGLRFLYFSCIVDFIHVKPAKWYQIMYFELLIISLTSTDEMYFQNDSVVTH